MEISINFEKLENKIQVTVNKVVLQTSDKYDVIILDPPRAGMHPNVIAGLLYAKPERIVYVSCNPGTQARDLGLLSESYKVEKTQPVDMFPHTHHVENNEILLRK